MEERVLQSILAQRLGCDGKLAAKEKGSSFIGGRL